MKGPEDKSIVKVQEFRPRLGLLTGERVIHSDTGLTILSAGIFEESMELIGNGEYGIGCSCAG